LHFYLFKEIKLNHEHDKVKKALPFSRKKKGRSLLTKLKFQRLALVLFFIPFYVFIIAKKEKISSKLFLKTTSSEVLQKKDCRRIKYHRRVSVRAKTRVNC